MTDEEGFSEKHEKMMHKSIKKVSNDIDEMKFNTSVAQFMTCLNEFVKDKYITKGEYKVFLQLLNPFAPHMTEELNKMIGETIEIAKKPWPKYDEDKTIEDEIEIPVQINGKLKTTVLVPKDISEEEIKNVVDANEVVKNFVTDKTIVKQIYVPGRIYNIVVK